MTNANFKPGIGRLATDRYEFQDHLEGINPPGFTDFRHTADQIDMNPSVIGSATTVQSSLSAIADFITGESGAGQGFIAVGDGYDTWHIANGTNNYDPTVPSLDTILNPIFQAIINGTAIPVGYARIQRGGVVLIKAGTYTVANSITVPPGITLLGEGYGTKIINATSLNLSSSPPTPKASPTPAPVFIIAQDSNRTANDAAVDPNLFIFSRQTRIMNMVIADNFVEPTLLGDNYYKLPQNKVTPANQPSTFVSGTRYTTYQTTVSSPLVLQKQGSSLDIDNVIFMGRVNYSSPNIVSQCTNIAVALDQNNIVYTGTSLTVKNSSIDGFSIPVVFEGAASFIDSCTITNNKIRSYAVFTTPYTIGPGESGGLNYYVNPLSAFFIINDNTVLISNNALYADAYDNAVLSSFIGVASNTINNSPPIDTANGNTGKIIFSHNFQRTKQNSTNFFVKDLFDVDDLGPVGNYYFESFNNSVGKKNNTNITGLEVANLSAYTYNGVSGLGYTIDATTKPQGSVSYDEIIYLYSYNSLTSLPIYAILPNIYPNNIGRTITIKTGLSVTSPVTIVANQGYTDYSFYSPGYATVYIDMIDIGYRFSGLSKSSYTINNPGDSITLTATLSPFSPGGTERLCVWAVT